MSMTRRYETIRENDPAHDGFYYGPVNRLCFFLHALL